MIIGMIMKSTIGKITYQLGDMEELAVLPVEIMQSHFHYRCSVLSPKPRTLFDPSNPRHMKDFCQFVKYGNWKKGCRYLLEEPFSDIPTMIRAKIADFMISKYMDKV